MPIQLQNVHSSEDPTECPLCMEPLEVDDINFFPCQCGYQICRFCWHRIRTDENGLCPACRKPYPENPAEFKPLSEQELQTIKQQKKQREVERKQKITDNRRHLASVRVLQKNLVFVVGLSQRLADPESPSSTAYVTYSKMEEALRAIQSVNNVYIDGRTLKASLGTTKYCSNYLKNQQCVKADCMYLHEIGDQEASFTKDDMQASKHQEYEQKLIQEMLNKEKELEMNKISEDISLTKPEGNIEDSIDGLKMERPRRHSGSVEKPSSPLRHNASRSNSTNASSKLSSSVGDTATSSAKLVSRSKKSNQKKSKGNSNSINDNNLTIDTGKGKGVNGVDVNKDDNLFNSTVSSQKDELVLSKSQSPVPTSNLSYDENSTSKLENELDSRFSTKPIDIPSLFPQENTTASNTIGQYNSSLSEASSSVGQGVSSVEGSCSQASRPPSGHPDTSLTPSPKPTEFSKHSRLSLYHNNNRGTDFSNSLFSDSNSTTITVSNSKNFPEFIQNQLGGSQGLTNSLNLSSTLSPNLLPPGMTDIPSSDGWGNVPQTNRLPDTMPIKSTNDWESAFGFGPSSTKVEDPIASTEDDLGFDPFMECSKGLADLMEKEMTMKDQQHQIPPITNPRPPGSSNWLHTSGFPHQTQRPETLPTSFRNLPPFGNHPPSESPLNISQFGHNTDKPSPQMPGHDILSRLPQWNTNFQESFLHHNHKPMQNNLPPRNENNGLSSPGGLSSSNLKSILTAQGLFNPTNSGNNIKSNLMPDGQSPGNTSRETQEWQNGLRALLPSVNINFATGSNSASSTAPPPPPGVHRPIGLNTDPFMNLPMKTNVPPPPGVPGFSNRAHFMQNKQWNSQASPGSLHSPGSRGVGNLMSPTSSSSIFPGGSLGLPLSSRAPSDPSSYFQDPAIITGGASTNNIGNGDPFQSSSLLGNKLSTTFGGNNNNNSTTNEDTPHWMQSLQHLTENDSPINPTPSAFPNMFPTHASSIGHGWPNIPMSSGNFGAPNLVSQPPPGFQVRPGLGNRSSTKFGMSHNLLENQTQ